MEKSRKKQPKKPKLYQGTGDRVKQIVKAENITLTKLCELIPGDGADGHPALSTISQIVNGYDKLSEDMASKIIKAFPEKGYRKAWLLLGEGPKTEREYAKNKKYSHFISEINAAEKEDLLLQSCVSLMELHGAAFTEREHPVTIKFPSYNVQLAPPPAAIYKDCELTSADVTALINRIHSMVKSELECIRREKNGISSLSDLIE